MQLAFSPCPNDTFLLNALVSGKIELQESFELSLHDIQELNCLAGEGRADIIKISFAAYPSLASNYVVLPVGAALGWGHGPKLVARAGADHNEALKTAEHLRLALCSSRVAIPGSETTACLLFRHFFGTTSDERLCIYNEVAPLLRRGQVDYGVVIHETRFTLAEQGLVAVCDLGEMWHQAEQCALPLGGVVAKRELGYERLRQWTVLLQNSLKAAWQSPEQAMPYMRRHAIETSEEVIRSHVDLYVTKESYTLSEQGRASIRRLLGLNPAFDDSQKIFLEDLLVS